MFVTCLLGVITPHTLVNILHYFSVFFASARVRQKGSENGIVNGLLEVNFSTLAPHKLTFTGLGLFKLSFLCTNYLKDEFTVFQVCLKTELKSTPTAGPESSLCHWQVVAFYHVFLHLLSSRAGPHFCTLLS